MKTITKDGQTRMSDFTADEADDQLHKLLDKPVDVFWSREVDARANFETCVSVAGILEYAPDRKQYRVLVDPPATSLPERHGYAYFEAADVKVIGGPLSSGRWFVAIG